MKHIIIRTLGGRGIGYGHFYRCISLAKAIKSVEEKINITFLVNQEISYLLENGNFNFILSNGLDYDYDIIKKLVVDLFVFDSYLGDNNYLKRIKEKTKIMLIDDNNDIYDSKIPDIIYNGNIHGKDLGYADIGGQLKLLGLEYLIMKEEYWESNKKDIEKDGILITTGGTDEYRVTINIIDEIRELNERVIVIIGPGYDDSYIKEIENISTKNIELINKPISLKEYISRSNIVITAAGSTVYEILSQKSIPIIFSIADNQDLICNELESIGIEYLGKHPNIRYDKIMESINCILDKEDKEDSVLDKKLFLLDGSGANRAVKEIVEYICNH